MEFLDIVKKRYAVRSYNGKKVEEEKLAKILEAGRVAPSALNLQPVRLLVVQDEERLEKFSKATKIYQAPLAIIVCADYGKAWVRPFDGKQSGDIDASIMTDHMMLQATELGLSSVWICQFKADIIKQEFEIPENLEPVNILAIGYSDAEPHSPDRHSETRIPMEELVSYEEF